jgi:hypothetical protein
VVAKPENYEVRTPQGKYRTLKADPDYASG